MHAVVSSFDGTSEAIVEQIQQLEGHEKMYEIIKQQTISMWEYAGLYDTTDMFAKDAQDAYLQRFQAEIRSSPCTDVIEEENEYDFEYYPYFDMKPLRNRALRSHSDRRMLREERRNYYSNDTENYYTHYNTTTHTYGNGTTVAYGGNTETYTYEQRNGTHAYHDDIKQLPWVVIWHLILKETGLESCDDSYFGDHEFKAYQNLPETMKHRLDDWAEAALKDIGFEEQRTERRNNTSSSRRSSS